MADLNKLLTPLFLNEGEIRKIIELLFFSYRDFTEGPDKVLEKINFGRAHHRVIYFVGKQKNLTIKDLTGAGDLFASGFLHGLINNKNTKESLEIGTEMSSKVIQIIGARLNN